MNEYLPEHKFPVTPYDMDYVHSARLIAVSCGTFVVSIAAAEKHSKCVTILHDSEVQGATRDLYEQVKYDDAVDTLILLGAVSVVLVGFDGKKIAKTRVLSSETLGRSCRNFGWDPLMHYLLFARRVDHTLEDILVFRYHDDNESNDLILNAIVPSSAALSMSYSPEKQSIVYMKPPNSEGREVRVYNLSENKNIGSTVLFQEGKKVTLMPEKYAHFPSVEFHFLFGSIFGAPKDPFLTPRE